MGTEKHKTSVAKVCFTAVVPLLEYTTVLLYCPQITTVSELFSVAVELRGEFPRTCCDAVTAAVESTNELK